MSSSGNSRNGAHSSNRTQTGGSGHPQRKPLTKAQKAAKLGVKVMQLNDWLASLSAAKQAEPSPEAEGDLFSGFGF